MDKHDIHLNHSQMLDMGKKDFSLSVHAEIYTDSQVPSPYTSVQKQDP